MPVPSIVALLTDFGIRDSYVAEMKGVMLSLNPNLRLIDISHSVPPGDVKCAAYLLWRSRRWFPDGTIFLSVIDPGVGSDRKILLLQTKEHYYVGPDNGLFTMVSEECDCRVWEVSDRKFMGREISGTFHGRDIMAPVCGHLSLGEMEPSAFGAPVERIVRLDMTAPSIDGTGVEGEIISVDRFGNAITNITADRLADLGSHACLSVSIGRLQVGTIRRTFSSVGDGETVAYAGSAGLLEMAVNGGDFARLYGIKPGDKVRVESDRS